MWEEIRIRDLGVIDASTLELGPGFTAITGETGAGKTMVVTALGLLLGSRSDSQSVRTGASGARVEGVIDTARLPQTAQTVVDLGGEVEDDRVVLARNISAQGRSRAFVGGAGVPVTRLGEVTEPLVALHGQSDQHRLLRGEAQREALDTFGGPAVLDVRAAHETAYDRLAATERELAELRRTLRERAQEADVLRFGLAEIEKVAPEPGEEAQLAADESRLGASDTLLTAAEQAREALSADAADGADALGTTASAQAALDRVREFDAEAGSLAERLREVGYLLNDLAGDVASYASRIEVDPARLAGISERRAALSGLTRKYGEDLAEVLEWSRTAALRLAELDSTDDAVDGLVRERDRLRTELAEITGRLTQARAEAAERLAARVTEELHSLAMPHAQVSIRVEPRIAEPPEDPQAPGRRLQTPEGWRQLSRSGTDEVEFLLAANKGSEGRSLDKGASGGELSRVMLGLEVAMADTVAVPTFVFDEVDSGVGGKAAVEIGRRLAMLSRHAQVIVVTHLPQVAAYADRHVLVEKSQEGTITRSGLVVLDEQARTRELARMLAGMEESDSALAHAEELRSTAQEFAR